MKAADITLAKRYARAYMALHGQAFSTPLGESTARSRISELEKVRAAAGQFKKLLLHPLVGFENKKEILAKLLPGGLGASPAAEFARLLLKENRFYLLDAALAECEELFNSHAGLVRAEVYSRHPLSREELARLEKDLAAVLGKKPLVRAEVSEEAIGGLRIRINDLFIDATIKGRLEKLKKSILAD
ncbi:MAG: ATP synthase F1 subunit delta [Elusimicrobia bacterium RIFOXYB2_FULL_62_6]|nr:MAG: ATP synthase F1 subunit delta [Elusimicrobia bacterium RIFOXYB2_FULL_62_6]